MIAETPDLSNDLTRYGKCSTRPPLSASKTNGLVVTSIMSFNEDILAEKSTDELSGLPFVAESVKLDDHIPSNSKFIFCFKIFKRNPRENIFKNFRRNRANHPGSRSDGQQKDTEDISLQVREELSYLACIRR